MVHIDPVTDPANVRQGHGFKQSTCSALKADSGFRNEPAVEQIHPRMPKSPDPVVRVTHHLDDTGQYICV